VLTHAAYRGQTLIVRLLDLATSQQIQLKDAGIDHQGSPAQNSDRFTEQRLDLWTHLRDE
jgi:hypothetical protein